MSSAEATHKDVDQVECLLERGVYSLEIRGNLFKEQGRLLQARMVGRHKGCSPLHAPRPVLTLSPLQAPQPRVATGRGTSTVGLGVSGRKGKAVVEGNYFGDEAKGHFQAYVRHVHGLRNHYTKEEKDSWVARVFPRVRPTRGARQGGVVNAK
jgi:hypothetical protein